MRPVAAILVLSVAATAARGDGGLLRLSQQAGPYRVAVFTDPTPLRAGPIDVSVLVQDAATGQPVLDVPVVVSLTNAGTRLEVAADHAGATNKLLYAANLELAEAGAWRLEVRVAAAEPVAVEIEAAGSAPRWRQLWPWFTWPVVPVLLFALLEARRLRRRPRAGAGGIP
jgi:hypothetical protein